MPENKQIYSSHPFDYLPKSPEDVLENLDQYLRLTARDTVTRWHTMERECISASSARISPMNGTATPG